VSFAIIICGQKLQNVIKTYRQQLM